MSDELLEALLQSGFRYALSLTRDVTHAEDVLQDAWLAVLGVDGPRTKPYLFRAIRTRFLNHRRRDTVVTLLSLNDDLNGVPEPVEDFSEPASERELAHLADGLATLRPTEREALYLTVVEGYTAQEAADLTGQPRGTVLSLMHRARAKLRRYLGGSVREA